MAYNYKLLTKEDFRNGDKKIFERLFGGSQKGAVSGTGVTIVESAGKTIFTLTNVAVPTVDATTSGAGGGLKLYTFPEGLLDYRGAVANVTLTAAAGITATAAVVSALGTVAAAADATLTSTEADLLPSTATSLTASAGTFAAVSTTAQSALLDGTATAKALYLNFGIPDAGSTANSTITVSGTITVAWSLIADK